MDKVNRIIEILELNLVNSVGARELEVSLSQYKRYKANYKKHGPFGLLHKGLGNTNARKYTKHFEQHVIESYRAESVVVQKESNGLRKARKLRVFSRVYADKHNVILPYTTCKKILNDAGITSPICRFEEEHVSNIALENAKNKPRAGFEFQGDGSNLYKFPDDDFCVVAHVVVEASSSQLCGLDFQKGECNIGYYYAYRYAFMNVGVPEQNSTDGRTTFFNPNDITSLTTMGAILERLGVKTHTTRNCNRNNKVENAHDPVRDYIFDQMLIDGIRSFKEANEKLPYYIDLYNRVLNHKINEDNVLRKLSIEEIDEAFLTCETRSMDRKYTIQINNNKYFVVRNNTLLQKRSKTKINVYTTYNQKKFVLYGNNKYELVEASVENLVKLKKIDGHFVTAMVKKNGYNFSFEGNELHAVDSVGNPIKLKHRDQVKLSIIDNKIKKVRTNKGVYNVATGVVETDEVNLKIENRKISYRQTLEYNNSEYVLIDCHGERFISKTGTEIGVVVLNGLPTSAICNGVTYTVNDIKHNKHKYYIPRSHYDARKTFGDLL